MDSKIHRVPLLDGKPGKLDGAYLGYADGVPAGFIQNHKTGEKITWKATGHVITEEQKETLQAEAAQRSAQRQLDLAREQERLTNDNYFFPSATIIFTGLLPHNAFSCLLNPLVCYDVDA